jgi:hypothetical protein
MTEKGREHQTNFVAMVRFGKLLPATQENKEKDREIRKVLYRDYSRHRVPDCLSLRRNWPPPRVQKLLPQASVSPPWNQRGEDQQSLAVEGVRDPIRTTGKKAWHSVYSWCTFWFS